MLYPIYSLLTIFLICTTLVFVNTLCSINVELLSNKMIEILNEDELCECLGYKKPGVEISKYEIAPCNLYTSVSNGKMSFSAISVCGCIGYATNDSIKPAIPTKSHFTDPDKNQVLKGNYIELDAGNTKLLAELHNQSTAKKINIHEITNSNLEETINLLNNEFDSSANVVNNATDNNFEITDIYRETFSKSKPVDNKETKSVTVFEEVTENNSHRNMAPTISDLSTRPINTSSEKPDTSSFLRMENSSNTRAANSFKHAYDKEVSTDESIRSFNDTNKYVTLFVTSNNSTTEKPEMFSSHFLSLNTSTQNSNTNSKIAYIDTTEEIISSTVDSTEVTEKKYNYTLLSRTKNTTMSYNPNSSLNLTNVGISITTEKSNDSYKHKNNKSDLTSTKVTTRKSLEEIYTNTVSKSTTKMFLRKDLNEDERDNNVLTHTAIFTTSSENYVDDYINNDDSKSDSINNKDYDNAERDDKSSEDVKLLISSLDSPVISTVKSKRTATPRMYVLSNGSGDSDDDDSNPIHYQNSRKNINSEDQEKAKDESSEDDHFIRNIVYVVLALMLTTLIIVLIVLYVHTWFFKKGSYDLHSSRSNIEMNPK